LPPLKLSVLLGSEMPTREQQFFPAHPVEQRGAMRYTVKNGLKLCGLSFLRHCANLAAAAVFQAACRYSLRHDANLPHGVSDLGCSICRTDKAAVLQISLLKFPQLMVKMMYGISNMRRGSRRSGSLSV
jgi:hypothetical protein